MLGQRAPVRRGLDKEMKSMSFDERNEDQDLRASRRESKWAGGFDMEEEDDEDMCDIIGAGGSEEDNEFDTIVGVLEQIIIDPEFNKLQNKYCIQHCRAFEDTEENKLCYTDIFDKYTELLESYIEHKLTQVIPGFRLDKFAQLCNKHKHECTGDVFDLLLSLGDFNEFKHLMLSHKAALNGNLYNAFSVTGFRA